MYTLLANTINSIQTGSAPPVSISFDDITHSCFPNSSWSQTTPININLPATAVAGNLVFMFLEDDSPLEGDWVATPTGWTKEFSWYGSTSDNSGRLFWKILNASDVSLGYVSVYALTTYNRDGQGWTWIANGVDTSNPISDIGVWTQSVSVSKTIAGITPTANGLAVGFWGFDGGDGEPTTITSGWTKLAEQECDSSASGTFGGFASLESTSGTPTGNLVVTALISDGWGGIMVNFKAA